jgi:hypothetical protein
MPCHLGEPILDTQPRQAFRVSAEGIITSIRQQFTSKELALRELGQNAQDAQATRVLVNYRLQEGCLILDFLDDGCGMSQEVIHNNYLRLFSSSKDGVAKKVGKWSLGRLTLLCYEPERIEVFTRCANASAYRVVIEKDLSGRLYEIDDSTAEQLIGAAHGTLVRMTRKVEGPQAFADLVSLANQSMEKELCWIAPELTVTTVEFKDGELKFGSRRLNKPKLVPGRFSSRMTVRLSNTHAEVDCAIGLQTSESSALAPITLCCGGIPIERPSGLPWTGSGGEQTDFGLRGLHIVLDSFDFQTNIGRNVVYRDTPVMEELLPKLFHKLILERFVVPLARMLVQDHARYMDYHEAIVQLLADVCIRSSLNDYAIPKEVLAAPFIGSFVSFRPYSLVEIDSSVGPVYFTHERATMLHLRELEGDGCGVICISLANLPWEFRKFLEQRYAERLLLKENNLLVEGETEPALADLAAAVTERLERGCTLAHRMTRRMEFDGMALRPTVGRLVHFDGTPEMRLRTAWVKSPDRICLNHNNLHIQNLLRLLHADEHGHAELAAHFLMRELLFEPGLKVSMHIREQMLASDLGQRFIPAMRVPPEPDADEDAELLDAILQVMRGGFLDL